MRLSGCPHRADRPFLWCPANLRGSALPQDSGEGGALLLPPVCPHFPALISPHHGAPSVAGAPSRVSTGPVTVQGHRPPGLSAVSPLDTPHPSRGGGICRNTSLEADPPPRSGSRPLEPSEGQVCAWLQLRHPRGRPGTWAGRELGLGEAPGHSEEGPPRLLRAGPGVCLLHPGGLSSPFSRGSHG